MITTVIIRLLRAQLVTTSLFAQAHWTKYERNPVLTVGDSGAWDSRAVAHSAVIYDGRMYQIWYTASDGKQRGIGHATSPDGVNWTKDIANPVLDVGADGTWDSKSMYASAVRFDSTRQDSKRYQMWYTGLADSIARVGHAMSPDGTTWMKDSTNPVLDVGAPGSWDNGGVGDASILFNGSTYKMWFLGGDKPIFSHGKIRIGYATSRDGLTWTKADSLNPVFDVGGAGTWDSQFVFGANVFSDSSWSDSTRYRMFYDGGYAVNPRIGYATSPDGIHWKRYRGNPVVDWGPPGAWDSQALLNASIVYDGRSYGMWYTGHGGGHSGIGYATSPPDSTSRDR